MPPTDRGTGERLRWGAAHLCRVGSSFTKLALTGHGVRKANEDCLKGIYMTEAK